MARLTRVVPAILTDNPKALETMVCQAESFASYVQIDIMDGRFVPSQSITCQHLSALSIRFSWEAHLMVESPERHLQEFRQAGAQKVVFHYEATASPEGVISQARDIGLAVRLAINPETPVSAIRHLTSLVDDVLLLTVHPGYYGSQFIPEVLDKVPALRDARPEIEIGVDGGIKEGNIAEVARRGADVIFVGSAVFLQPQPGDSFRHLSSLAQQGSRQHQ